jgi:hypothetical protein
MLIVRPYAYLARRVKVRPQKAQLKTIVKTATICKDGKIELEFRVKGEVHFWVTKRESGLSHHSQPAFSKEGG